MVPDQPSQPVETGPPAPPPGYSADEVIPAPPQGYSESDIVPADWKPPAPKKSPGIVEGITDAMSKVAGVIGQAAETAGGKLLGGYGAKPGVPMVPSPPPGVGGAIASQVTGEPETSIESQIVEGVSKAAQGLTTPGNTLLAATMGGAPEIVGRGAGLAFGATMLQTGSQRLKKAIESGSTADMVQAGIELGMGLHATTSSFKGGGPKETGEETPAPAVEEKPAPPPGYTATDVVAAQPLEAPKTAEPPSTELPPEKPSAPIVDEMRPKEAAPAQAGPGGEPPVLPFRPKPEEPFRVSSSPPPPEDTLSINNEGQDFYRPSITFDGKPLDDVVGPRDHADLTNPEYKALSVFGYKDGDLEGSLDYLDKGRAPEDKEAAGLLRQWSDEGRLKNGGDLVQFPDRAEQTAPEEPDLSPGQEDAKSVPRDTFQQADKVNYDGEPYIVMQVKGDNLELMRELKDGSTEELTVRSDSRDLERLPPEPGAPTYAVKLKDGTVISGEEGRGHMSLATAIDKSGRLDDLEGAEHGSIVNGQFKAEGPTDAELERTELERQQRTPLPKRPTKAQLEQFYDVTIRGVGRQNAEDPKWEAIPNVKGNIFPTEGVSGLLATDMKTMAETLEDHVPDHSGEPEGNTEADWKRRVAHIAPEEWERMSFNQRLAAAISPEKREELQAGIGALRKKIEPQKIHLNAFAEELRMKAAGELNGPIIDTTTGSPALPPKPSEAGFLRFGKATPEEKAQALIRQLTGRNKALTGRHNLNLTENFDPKAFDALKAKAGAGGAVRGLVGRANEAINKVAGKGFSDKFWQAQHESNLEGMKDTYRDLRQSMANAPDEQLVKTFKDQGKALFDAAVEHFNEGDPKAIRQTKAAASRAIKAGDMEGLRKVTASVFKQAEDHVPAMSPKMRSLIDTPEYAAARNATPVKSLMSFIRTLGEKSDITPKQRVGPAGDYVPLAPKLDLEAPRARNAGDVMTFAKARPGSSRIRTGLGDYDQSNEAMIGVVKSNFRAMKHNEALQFLEDSGVGKRLKPFEKAPTTMSLIPGNPEETVTFPVGHPQFRDGKEIPAPRMAFPKSIGIELRNALDVDHPIEDMDRGDMIKNGVLKVFLRGIQEPGFHTQRQISASAHAMGVPYVEAARRLAFFDDQSPGAQESFEMFANHGVVPDRFASIATNPETAALYGAEHAKKAHLDFSPFVFGPHGVDMRNRLMADGWMKEMQAQHPDTWGAGDQIAARVKFQENLGSYLSQLKTSRQKFVGQAAIQPFITARMTALRNSLEATGLSENLTPLKGADLAMWRVRQQFTSHILGGLAAWYTLHKLVTGKEPDTQGNGKIMQVPIPPWARDYPFLKPFFSSNAGSTPYAGIGWMFPDAMTLLRLTGAQRAANTAMRGGNTGQILSSAAAEAASYALGFFSGPLAETGAAVAGVHPYLTEPKLSGLMPSIPKGKGLQLQDRLVAGINELLPNLGQAAHTASLSESERSQEAQKQPKLPRALVNVLFKNLVAGEENVAKTRARVAQDRKF